MELKIGSKGRITLPAELMKTLGLKVGDALLLDAKGNAILLKPKAMSVKETKGIAKLGKVDLEEIEEALGKSE